MALPLPQFQPKAPEAVHAQVIQQPVNRTSFFGAVLPGMIQGANALRQMIEGNPEIEFQRDNLADNSSRWWIEHINASDNDDERRQRHQQAMAYAQKTGNEGLASALDAMKDPTLKSKDKWLAGEQRNAAERVRADLYGDPSAGGTAGSAAGTAAAKPQQPGFMGPDAGAGGSLPAPSTGLRQPTPTDGGALPAFTAQGDMTTDALPGNTAVPPGEAPPEEFGGDVGQTMGAALTPGGQAQAAGAALGEDFGQRMVDDASRTTGISRESLWYSPRDGVVAAMGTDAPLQAKLPPPRPTPEEPPALLQAASGIGVQAGASNARLLRDVSYSNYLQKIQHGTPVSAEDVAYARLTEVQANQVLQDAQIKLGVPDPGLDLQKISTLAHYIANPAGARDAEKQEKGTGPMATLQQWWLTASNSSRALALKAAEELAKGEQAQDKLNQAYLKNLRDAQHQARQDALNATKAEEHARNERQNTAIRAGELAVHQQRLEMDKTKASRGDALEGYKAAHLQAQTSRLNQMQYDDATAKALARLGIKGTTGTEFKEFHAVQASARQELAEADKNLGRIDNQIKERERVIAQDPRMREDSTKAVKAEVETLKKERETAVANQTNAKAALDRANGDIATYLRRNGRPTPNDFLSEFVQNPENRPRGEDGVYKIAMPSTQLRGLLNDVYHDRLKRGPGLAKAALKLPKNEQALLMRAVQEWGNP